MKKFFLAIRHGDLQKVKDLINNNPELVHCTAKQPPKKDDGQSPLQVALKAGNFAIADYLLDMGVDPNFMESGWNVRRGGWRDEPVRYEEMSNPEVTGQAYRLLEKMISLGGDVNKLDSVGVNSVWRFFLDAYQVLPRDDDDN